MSDHSIFLPIALSNIRQHWPLYILGVVLASYVRTKYLSPLSKYPGPFLAGFTEAWKIWTIISLKERYVYKELHEKYGPVFRDGPNSLSYCDVRAIDRIFGSGRNILPKEELISLPGADKEHPGTFFATDATRHRNARRKVANAYSMTSILKLEPRVDEIIQYWEETLAIHAEAGDVVDLSNSVMFLIWDSVSSLAFGKEFGLMRSGTDSKRVTVAFSESFIFFTLLRLVPRFRSMLLSQTAQKFALLPDNVGVGLISKLANDIIEEQLQSSTENAGFVTLLLQSTDPEGNPIHKEQMKVEVASVLNAGADTTIASMLGIIAFILQDPIRSAKLREEIDTADAAGMLSKPTVTFKEASKLPYLDAFIQEALRLSCPVHTVLSREVPTGGAEILAGDIVPAGTKLGINNWVLMHNKEAYGDDVEEFKPERWLDPENHKKLQKIDLVFGSGARACIGKNIANMELYKMVLQFHRNFEVQSVDPSKPWVHAAGLFLSKKEMMVTIKRRNASVSPAS